jgi:hypothetical protein
MTTVVTTCGSVPGSPAAGEGAVRASAWRHAASFFAGILCVLVSASPIDAQPLTGNITVDLSRGPIAKFLPDQVFGATLDGHEEGDTASIYWAKNIQKMRSAGLRKISYRLRTELAVEAWHWRGEGTWSDPQHQQGYWVSSDSPRQFVLISHGYKLPRRGNTIDQAANDGYSRLTDGDASSFWKSNPYLDQRYTGEANADHPQWVVVEFGTARPVNAIRIDWARPYGTRFEVQYSAEVSHDESLASTDPDFGAVKVKKWRTFPNGVITKSDGKPVLLRLADVPVQTQHIRILLYESSGTGPDGAVDIRDKLGFAIREIFLGVEDNAGTFHDEVDHAPSAQKQTITYTSSTDPWHRAIDIDKSTEQPGFDLVFRSGLTSGLPALVPVPILYDTPENAKAEIRFLKKRGYPIRQIELGEEPDGQQVSPEHVAALYLEFATAIRAEDPTLVLGGPSFQSAQTDARFEGEQSETWLTRFLNYLRSRDRLGEYGFLSFEWYPFNNLCQDAGEQLLNQPKLLADAIRRFKAEGVPPDLPLILAEYGFSAYAGRSMVEIESALFTADVVGQFLSLGGNAAFLYGYEPNTPMHEGSACAGYGQMMLFEADGRGQARWPMPSYFAARLITHEWTQPSDRAHKLYPISSDVHDARGRAAVSAYAVQRPDGKWSIMLVNKDPQHDYLIDIAFTDGKSVWHFGDQIITYQYSSKEYAWKDSGEDGHPLRTQPPLHFRHNGDRLIRLPAFSLSVVRGKFPPGHRLITAGE